MTDGDGDATDQGRIDRLICQIVERLAEVKQRFVKRPRTVERRTERVPQLGERVNVRAPFLGAQRIAQCLGRFTRPIQAEERLPAQRENSSSLQVGYIDLVQDAKCRTRLVRRERDRCLIDRKLQCRRRL